MGAKIFGILLHSMNQTHIYKSEFILVFDTDNKEVMCYLLLLNLKWGRLVP